MRKVKTGPLMLLVINGGSSSIKFAILRCSRSAITKVQYGQISAIGPSGTQFLVNGQKRELPKPIHDYAGAIAFLINYVEHQDEFGSVTAIGHRIVHGMQHTEPALVTPQLLQDLKHTIPYDPDHLPEEIKLIEAFGKHYPRLTQYVCFDTAFHQTMPAVARLLPVPQRFTAQGIQRYGFHGISYNYLMDELEKISGKKSSQGKVILAHLGSGASMAAVYKGKSIDTSMGFTPAGGLPMSSRSGDMDPGLAWIMMKAEKLSPGQFNHVINHESGLLGISGTSGDMSELLKQQTENQHCAEAVEFFCYQVKKWIGAFAAALGGVDTLVFAGGIGENSPEVRARICTGLNFLGIELDNKLNKKNQGLISAGKVNVRVMQTDEEHMIAKIIFRLITTSTTLN